MKRNVFGAALSALMAASPPAFTSEEAREPKPVRRKPRTWPFMQQDPDIAKHNAAVDEKNREKLERRARRKAAKKQR